MDYDCYVEQYATEAPPPPPPSEASSDGQCTTVVGTTRSGTPTHRISNGF